ncbi:hypothetical protein PR048_007294 [Dryococelus australis]|uniref:HAT C-terminal dimerisation domain-containing protein n=1 Tax=Dryococelus australis TaxID=614101 RepID=A0ABQ9ID86_9NEOP|nr:hypothetical protein PR048_007294 [Dryococelus australis]
MPRTSSRQKNRDNTPATNPEEYYRRTLFIPYCDHFINHLEERFIGYKKLLTSFACLVPTGNSPTSQEISHFLQLSECYKNDLQDKNEDIYPDLNIALEIFATVPVSTATPERSFSTLWRFTMGHERLADLAAPNIHIQINISSEKVIHMLQKTTRRRLEFVL